MKRIKYVAYYDTTDSQRNIVLSAVNKIDYIISALNRAGYAVDMLSFAGAKGNRIKRVVGECRVDGNGNSYKLFPSWCGPRVLNPLIRIMFKMRFALWFLFNVKKGEKVIVYHSLGYTRFFRLLKKLRKFELIGEIEEIYQDVSDNFSEIVKVEEFRFFDACDKFIVPTKILKQRIASDDIRPDVVVHGTYHSTKRACRYDDGKIHIVYAGTFDPNKGGASIALESARLLDNRFHLHILGWGNDAEISAIKQAINDMPSDGAVVTYDGLKRGDDFTDFLSKCHIGLSTQNPELLFNNTSFPSKVLTYMTAGLKVVSFNIDVLAQSSLARYIFFSADNTAAGFAEAINAAAIEEKVDIRDFLAGLDNKFVGDLAELIEN